MPTICIFLKWWHSQLFLGGHIPTSLSLFGSFFSTQLKFLKTISGLEGTLTWEIFHIGGSLSKKSQTFEISFMWDLKKLEICSTSEIPIHYMWKLPELSPKYANIVFLIKYFGKILSHIYYFSTVVKIFLKQFSFRLQAMVRVGCDKI